MAYGAAPQPDYAAPMQTRTLGHSGLTVSVVGLGCNNFGGRLDQAATNAVVERALDRGITLFDTADIYGEKGGSETMLGRALGRRRSEIVLASKFGMDMGDGKKGAKPAYVRQALEASLKRLNTDYLDLYQLHAPDPETQLEDTLGALHELVQAGLVRFIGCSNLPAEDVRRVGAHARAHALTPFTSAQDEYSLLVREIEGELLPALRDLGMGLLPYFPLASGLLTGKYRAGAALPEGARITGSERAQERYLTPDNWARVENLRAYAEARDRTLLELAFGWLLAEPLVSSVIAGATRPEQIDANVAAAEWVLSDEERGEVRELLA